MERLSMVFIALLVIWLVLFNQHIAAAGPWAYDDDDQNTTTQKDTTIEDTTSFDDISDLLKVGKPGHSNYQLGLDYSDLESDAIIELNVGGQKITTLRSTLTAVPKSKLALKFAKHDKSQTKPYFFDYNPVQFQYLLDQLKAIKRRPQTPAYEHNFKAPDVDVPFKFSYMLSELGLNPDRFLSPLVGTHINLTVDSLIGWTECYHNKYDTPFDITVFNRTCKGKRLLIACHSSTDDKTLTVAGIGEREDLFPPCELNNCYPILLKNNTGFYYLPNKAWGFGGRSEKSTTINSRNQPNRFVIPQNELYMNPCDNSNDSSQYRLCWSLRSNAIGDRCGNSKNPRDTNKWERIIYQAV